MKASGQRNTNDLKRASGTGPHACRCAYCAAPRGGCLPLGRPGGQTFFWLRQCERLHVRLALQQRHHARLHLVAVPRIDRLGQRAFQVARRDTPRHGEVVIALHLQKPANDVGIRGRLQGAHRARLQALCGQGLLHVAQRHWQQCDSTGFGKALDDAKGRRGKLGQGRHCAGRYFQRETVGIAQAAPRRIGKALG